MKKLENFKCIAVIGAGTMGSGIAQVAASAGYHTLLYDEAKDAAARGWEMIKKNLAIAISKNKISQGNEEKILSQIKVIDEFSELKADVIIEAIIEKLEIKTELFRRLEAINDNDTILCSNTSSIPLTQIAASMQHPERLVGMHFFNPAHLMKLVEIVSGERTSKENAQTIFALAKKFDKEPVMVKDSPGFIVNRIGKLYHTEPLKILGEKIATVETIDALLEATGFKMGPFKL